MLYSVIVPVLCISGIGSGICIIAFSLRNFIKKRYRLFSAVYAAVSAAVLYILAQMLYTLANGFVCARDPVFTLAIYAGINVLLLFFLSDAVSAGKKRKTDHKNTG